LHLPARLLRSDHELRKHAAVDQPGGRDEVGRLLAVLVEMGHHPANMVEGRPPPKARLAPEPRDSRGGGRAA